MYSLIIIGISVATIVLLKLLSDKNLIKNLNLIIKILAVAFTLTGVTRFLLSDAFIEVVSGMSDPLQSFLRWGYQIGYAIIPMSVFFNSRILRNIASYFTLPVTVLAVIFYDDTFKYFLDTRGNGFDVPTEVRHIQYIIELSLALISIALMIISNKHIIDIKNKKEVGLTLLLLPLILMQMMPSYIPSSLLKELNLTTGMFGELHVLWLCCLFATAFLLHFILRNRTKEQKYTFLVFLSVAQVIHTTSQFLKGFTYSRLPLQLCNVAGFFYLIMLITRNRKLFNFCFLANLVGAAIALILTNFAPDAQNFWNIHYIYEHSYVVIVPILCVSLGIFPRPNKSAILDMLKIFSVYFVFVFVLGTILNGLETTPDYGVVNHFYMFNPVVAVEYLPFAGFTGAVHLTFGTFEVYPILVGVIYVFFIALNVIYYFISQGLFKLSDIIRASLAKKEEKLVTK